MIDGILYYLLLLPYIKNLWMSSAARGGVSPDGTKSTDPQLQVRIKYDSIRVAYSVYDTVRDIKTYNLSPELFQPHMRKINQWISQLPIKGTKYAVHVL